LNFLEDCLIGADPSKYYYVAQGMLTIDGVDDVEEMKLTDEAFDVLGFTQV
jgi:myosin heavy subunit